MNPKQCGLHFDSQNCVSANSVFPQGEFCQRHRKIKENAFVLNPQLKIYPKKHREIRYSNSTIIERGQTAYNTMRSLRTCIEALDDESVGLEDRFAQVAEVLALIVVLEGGKEKAKRYL